MARETDFLDLYKILGLNPGCGLTEFKQAYRRRVAVLHPDRRTGDQVSIIAAERLQQLTALYGAAMEFERRHGRLPGAPPVRPPPAEATQTPTLHPPTTAPRRRRMRWVLLMTAALACGAWMLWDYGSLPGSTESEPATASSQSTRPDSASLDQPRPAHPPTIELGMDADTVRSIEGDPLPGASDHWEYGPSWIHFENGKVVDWYSSPLHPLKTSSAQTSPTRD